MRFSLPHKAVQGLLTEGRVVRPSDIALRFRSATRMVLSSQDEQTYVCLGDDDLFLPVDNAVDVDLF